jgi:hypothetical protein
VVGRSQNVVAAQGITEQALRKNIADLTSAGKTARFVTVATRSQTHFFTPTDHVFRTSASLIVYAYQKEYVWPLDDVTVSYSGTGAVAKAAIPSLNDQHPEAAVLRALKIKQFPLRVARSNPSVDCNDCAVVFKAVRRRKSRATWGLVEDPWQQNPDFSPSADTSTPRPTASGGLLQSSSGQVRVLQSYYGDYWDYGSGDYFGDGSNFTDGNGYNFAADYSGDVLGIVEKDANGNCPPGYYANGDASDCLKIIATVSASGGNGLDYCTTYPADCIAYLPPGGSGGGNIAAVYAPSPAVGHCSSKQAAALSVMNQSFNTANNAGANKEGFGYTYDQASTGQDVYTPPVILTTDSNGIVQNVPQPPALGSDFTLSGVAHTHSDQDHQDPGTGIDQTTGNHFSPSDMVAAATLNVPIYVMVNVSSSVGGTLTISTKAFVWTPSATQPSGGFDLTHLPNGSETQVTSGINPGSTTC